MPPLGLIVILDLGFDLELRFLDNGGRKIQAFKPVLPDPQVDIDRVRHLDAAIGHNLVVLGAGVLVGVIENDVLDLDEEAAWLGCHRQDSQ